MTQLLTGEAVYLATDPDVLVVVHSPEPASRRDAAILLCPPFGWQEQASYRSMRTWAGLMAKAGYATARLAFPGSGDSAGTATDPDLLNAWTDSLAGTARWLRKRSGCQRVVAIGVGLGGLVAWRAAAHGAPIDDFVLWAVPDSGRRLLREMRAQSQIIAQQFIAPGRETVLEPENIVGFRMTVATSESLSTLRLDELTPPDPTTRRVLLIRRGILEPAGGLVRHLDDIGIAVETCDGVDFDDMMANPQQSVAPVRTVERIVEWLRSATGALERGSLSREGIPAERKSLRASGSGVEEWPVKLTGERGEMFGIVSRITPVQTAPIAIVFLGGGALPHTGPSRNWVEIGRRWAARGVPAVRLDLYGIGESGGEDPELLTDASFSAPWRARDAQLVLDQLVERGIADRFVLGGLCSGANVAMQTALIDDRVDGVMLINLFGFRYSEALAAERGRRLQMARGLPGARARSVDRTLIAAMMNYARPDRAWRLLRRSEERAEIVRARHTFDLLRNRSVKTLLLLGEHEPMAAQFARQRVMGDAARWPSLTYDIITTNDHMIRDLVVQRELNESVDRFLRSVTGAEGKSWGPPHPHAAGLSARMTSGPK